MDCTDITHIYHQDDSVGMLIRTDIDLDSTLGCGQAHRWRRMGDGSWQGVIGDSVVTMRAAPEGAEVTGTDDRGRIETYLRTCDDLEEIIMEISSKDSYVGSLAHACPGLRILKQDKWECTATYILATNANVARIGKMVESVCDTFGKDLGERHAFPTPREILDKRDEIPGCRLGFRESRLLEFAERVESGDYDPEALTECTYEECVSQLIGINGVGPKVADCVALFAYGHMSAFPIDARISKVMETVYGVTGSYKTVSGYGRKLFGRYAGYAQEYLYHSEFIPRRRDRTRNGERMNRSESDKSCRGDRSSSRHRRACTSPR